MARLLDSVLGHEKNISAFLEAFEHERLPNTFLFVGPPGIGKRTVAEALGQALLCESSIQACGSCGSCLRVAKGQHESLRIVRPEKNQIKIEQTRAILDFLSLQGLTRRRVVIIDDADKLNSQAANTLLKILEEPNPDTYFFLMAPSPAHVLATLRSRSQIMSFRPLTLAELKQKSNAPEWALRASQGSFERLRGFADKDEISSRELAVEFLRSWSTEPLGYMRNDFRQVFRDRSEAQSLGKHLSLLLRDAVSWQLGEREALLNPDQTALFKSMEVCPLEQIMGTAQNALRLEQDLAQHRDSQLLFEEFWIRSLRV